MSKICIVCKIEKEITSFNRHSGFNSGFNSTCRECVSLKSAERYKEKREEILAQKRDYYRRTKSAYRLRAEKHRKKKLYGLTLEDYENLFEKQGKSCAVCLSTEPKGMGWCTDHDHVTGKTRGILCFECNIGLGKFKDDPMLLRWAADYVSLHKQKAVAKAA
jgi:hypothetical protein